MILASGILFVDDDLEDQAIMADAMQTVNNSMPLYFAGSGIEAMEKLESMHREDHLPCLVVADLNMPKMSGGEMLALLKKDERFRQIPVVIYSTSVNKTEKEVCLQLGAHSYLTKPLSYQESLEVVNVFLDLCNVDRTV